MRKALLPLAAGLISLVLFSMVRAYPWQLALLMALAIGALAYSTQRSVENLRAWLVPEGLESASNSGPWLTPRKKEQGSDEQKEDDGGRANAPEEQCQPASEEAACENESS